MKPLTVKTFDLNQHKIVIQSFKIYFSAPATAIGIFQAIESVISKYGITWESCISLVVDNSIVELWNLERKARIAYSWLSLPHSLKNC